LIEGCITDERAFAAIREDFTREFALGRGYMYYVFECGRKGTKGELYKRSGGIEGAMMFKGSLVEWFMYNSSILDQR
jgi:hypothetical protein